MKISIALAVYNGMPLLSGQLDSIAAQRVLPFELVVSDDASTDGTAQCVKEFAARAPFPVKLVQHEANVGVTENFWAACAACSGDVIALCDDDDVWAVEKVERLEQAFSGPNAGFAMHESTPVNRALQPISRRGVSFQRTASGLTYQNPIDPVQGGVFPGYVQAIRRELFADFFRRWPGDRHREILTQRGSKRGVAPHDVLLPLFALSYAPAVLIPEKLVLHRIHPQPSKLNGLLHSERRVDRLRGRLQRVAQKASNVLSPRARRNARTYWVQRAELFELIAQGDPRLELISTRAQLYRQRAKRFG